MHRDVYKIRTPHMDGGFPVSRPTHVFTKAHDILAYVSLARALLF
jgi:hypothetical protein